MPRRSPPSHRTPRLGQHFLSDSRAIDRIVSAVGATALDHVLEIGPGGGALTGPLADAAGRLTAIEIDPAWAGQLAARFAGRGHVAILTGDILDFDLAGFAARAGFAPGAGPAPGADPAPGGGPAPAGSPGGRFLVTGNLPFSVATPIVRKLLDACDAAGEAVVREAVIMLQREVAHRLLATPGGRDYGFLSVHMSLRASAEVVLELPPGSFRPQPKVHSTVIRVRPRGRSETGLTARDIDALDRLLSAAFSQRRKKLANALAPLVREGDPLALDHAFEQAGVPPGARAEQVAPAAFLCLARVLEETSAK